MVGSRWRICGVLLLLCGSYFLCGCFYAYYPDTYDASDFEEFDYRVESDPPCLESPCTSQEYPDIHYSPVCEATITRQANGDYVFAVLELKTGYDCDVSYVPERVMTESEVERMLAWFGELHINLHPRPFCTIPMAGGGSGERSGGDVFFRWDDLELVTGDCDRARLDWGQAGGIQLFLKSLVTAGLSEGAVTSE